MYKDPRVIMNDPDTATNDPKDRFNLAEIASHDMSI